jgi:hypothetical protein
MAGVAIQCALACLLGQVASKPGDVPGPDVRCGSYCLLVALDALGKGPGDLDELERVLGPASLAGYSMLQLGQAAEHYGLKTISVETSMENLLARPERFACITLINKNHYVLVYDITESSVFIADPPRKYRINPDLFASIWSRKALLVGPAPFRSEESIARWRFVRRLGLTVIIGAGLLALATSVFAICSKLWRKQHPRRVATVLIAAMQGLLAGCGREDEQMPDATRSSIPVGLEARGGGSLSIQPPHINLGRIHKLSPGQSASVQAKLVNLGLDDLNILGVSSSCDCTHTSLGEKRIRPGSATTLDATIRLGESTVPTSTRIVIRSSDPISPVSELVISWQVRNPIYSEVSSLDLPGLVPGEGTERTVAVHLDGISLCKRCVIRAEPGSRTLSCSFSSIEFQRSPDHAPAPDPPDYEIGKLRVVIPPQDDERHYSEFISLEVRCGEESRARFTLPVSWTVTPIVQVSPHRLSLGTTRPGEQAHLKVLLRSKRGQLFRVLRGFCDTPEVLVGITSSERRDTLHVLDLEARTPQTEGPWRTTIHVETDHPEAEHIEIPLSGLATSMVSRSIVAP